MSGKKSLIAISTAVVLGVWGAASAAQAGTDQDEYQSGGYRVGPLGQVFGSPSEWGARGAPEGGYAYGFAAPTRTHQPAHRHTHAR